MKIIFSIIIFSVAVIAMSIGVIFNRKPLSGSCGGTNQGSTCDICGNQPEKCDNPEINFNNQ
tara:strand:- start:723 stop:908 length:186 start_codon:yes stop_codon:yes gene_type:complete